MFKKILSYVVVLTLVVSYFTYNVSASEDNSISLPVELFDFDADGLFYEYVWGHGMNLYGKGNYQVDQVTEGLVEETLGQDGRPVYTRDAVESAARTIQENLFAGYNDENFKAREYNIFYEFINHTPATTVSYTYADLFGKFENDNNDYWSLYGSTSTIVDHKIEDKWAFNGNDGIICKDTSSIVYKEAIPRGQIIELKYWIGWDGHDQKQFSIDLIDENNNSIKQVNLEDVFKNWGATYVEIPEGNGNVYLKLNGQTNTLIANMTISTAPILPLGDYNKTVSKYNAGELKTVEQCESCMDYAYLRLKNFFNTDFYLNKKDDSYKTMILNKEVTRNTASYAFDSAIQTVYDRDNKKLYNTKNGPSNGFFPLDHTGTEHLNQIENDVNSKHNYHFGMIVDGYFVYNKDANQFFSFSGDDDVYVFINGKLAVDLGGAHQKADRNITIDEDFANTYGLVNNQKTSFKLFYLERHTSESNCKIQTNLNISKNIGYEFVSGTEGKELPEGVINQIPVDNKDYFDGNTVQVTSDTFNDVIVADGVWKFISWDNTSITIPEKNTFVGTWVFTPKTVDNENNDSSNENTDPDEGNQEDKKPTIEGNDKDDKKPEVTDKKDNVNKVKTGDSTVVSIYLVMMMVACLGIIHILKKD